MDPVIEIKKMSAWYQSKKILDNISLSLPKLSILSLIGPSGCGKSTLARCINRLHDEMPGANRNGEILFHNHEISKMSKVELRKKIGMVFQRPQAFLDMSIFDNVAVGLRLIYFHSQADLGERIEQALKDVFLWDELKDILKSPARILSPGQQQRLCIARALSMEPEVLLLDEPTSYLDPISSNKIEELVSGLRNRLSVIIVTHNLQQAARISDYTGFLVEGTLIECDKTSKLFTNPSQIKTELYITGRYE